MKLSTCCLLFTIQVILASEEWNNFKTTYQKLYNNVAEENFRKQIFLKNWHLIEEHNKNYDQGLTTFKMGVNKFADLTERERFRHTRISDSDFLPKVVKTPKSKSSPQQEVPESIDWRDFGVITPVTDQLFCYSCWAYAIVGTVEAHNGIYHGKNVTLSQQNLEECVDPTFDCYQDMSRDMLDRTYQYIVDYGLDTYSSYPYEYPLETCHFKAEYSGATITDYASVPEGDEEELKRVVGTIGPVTVAITTNFDFDLYRSGVYYNENCMNTTPIFNHAVLIAGYGNEDGQDFWLVRNSWGTIFGEDGYIKMARNRDNNCGIASIARYPLM